MCIYALIDFKQKICQGGCGNLQHYSCGRKIYSSQGKRFQAAKRLTCECSAKASDASIRDSNSSPGDVGGDTLGWEILTGTFTTLSLSSIVPKLPRAFDQSFQMRWTKASNLRGASKTRQMRWTETGNLRLIEAVIQVEQEMMNESKRMGQHANGNGVNKWRRIVDRLPPELQEKAWDSRSQSYGGRYKCQSQFCTLLQGYRDRLAGRATQASKYPPTESVVQTLKWREDLLNGMCLTPVKRSLRTQRLLGFNARKSLQHDGQKLLKAVSDSSDGQSISSIEEDYFKVGIAEETGFKWTERARVQLIEAVMKVEERMLKTSKAIKGNKWDHIEKLLPLEMRGKTWDAREKKYKLKCSRVFFNFVYAYRDKVAGRNTVSSRRKLTKPMLRLLRRREDILNARCSLNVENSFRSGSSNHTTASDEQRLSMSSPDVQYSTSSAARSFDRSHELEIVERVRNFSDDVQRGEDFEQDEFSEKDTADSTQPSRSVNESKYLHNKSTSTQNLIQTRLQRRAQPESQIQDSRPAIRRQSTERRASLIKRKYTETRTLPESDDQEHVQAIVKRTVRKINVEVSLLSSWMENHMVAAGQRVVHEIISSEIASDKRRKFSGHRPCSFRVPEDFDDFARKTLSRIIDNQIGSSFQKLRIRFKEELKGTSLELAEKILNSYPHSMF